MAIIQASCPRCDTDRDLRPDQVRLVVYDDTPDRSYYGFFCYVCGENVSEPANVEVIKLLVVGGVRPEYVNIPSEARERHSGPVLNEDDLIAFGLALKNADPVERAKSDPRSGEPQ